MFTDVIDCGQQPGIVAQDTQYGAIVTLPCKSGKRLTFSCLENGEWRTTSTNCGNLPLPSSTTSKTKTKRTSGSNFAPVMPIAGGPLATESQYHLTAVHTAIPMHSISLAPAAASTLSSGIVVLLHGLHSTCTTANWSCSYSCWNTCWVQISPQKKIKIPNNSRYG